MSNEETMCPATMCPYLGLVDGSPWTGEEKSECEDSCGWWMGDHCLAGSEHDIDTWRVAGPTPPKDAWPECPYESDCQWQDQRDGPCAPRRMLMFGQTIDDTVML